MIIIVKLIIIILFCLSKYIAKESEAGGSIF